MGAYCELYLGKQPISTTKNEIDPFLLSLFLPEEIKSFKRKVKDRFQLLYGREVESEEEEQAVQFINIAKNIKDRLDVIGFTLKKAKESFEVSKEEKIESLESYIQDETYKHGKERWIQEVELLKESTFENFLSASKEIIDNGYGFEVSKEDLKTSNSIVHYLLQGRYGFENFPYEYDERILLRALLENCDSNTQITYDITELIEGGYYDEDNIDDIYEEVIERFTFDYKIGEKFLILTEGTSDIFILQSALKILYPHLEEYYSFMDFGISNASGSASSLVASIKSFVGAGVNNKIIALFDNDTAAESAIRGLSRTVIPKNIKIKQYPYLKSLDDYPTIGPSGIVNMNINGYAGSIEVYLGEDILLKEGELIPIQWKGYDTSLKKYQGEVINKKEIQKKFQDKAEKCMKDSTLIDKYDWSGLDEILKMIFNMFNE